MLTIIRCYKVRSIGHKKIPGLRIYETDEVVKNILNNSQRYFNRCLVCLRSFGTAATWCVGAIIVPIMYF